MKPCLLRCCKCMYHLPGEGMPEMPSFLIFSLTPPQLWPNTNSIKQDFCVWDTYKTGAVLSGKLNMYDLVHSCAWPTKI